MCQQFQTDIYFLIQRPISTFLLKYYGHKGDTQIVLIKDVNATDLMEETEIEAKFEEIRPKLFGYILDTLAKAIQIKSLIKLSYKVRIDWIRIGRLIPQQ